MTALILPDKWHRQPTYPVAVNSSLWPGTSQVFLPSLGYSGVLLGGGGNGTQIVTLQNANAPFTQRLNGEAVHIYRPNTSTITGESYKWQTPNFDVGPNASMLFYGYTLLDGYGAALEYGGTNWGLLINVDSLSNNLIASYVDNPTTAQFDATLSGAGVDVGVPIAVGLIKNGNTVTVVTRAASASTTGGNGGIRRSAGSGFGMEYAILEGYCGLMLGAISSVPISVNQMREVLASPYAIFKRQPRILYFTAGGGGATYNESVSEAIAFTSAQANTADILGTIAESTALTSAQANTWSGDVTATMTLAITTTEAGTLDTSQTVAESLAIITAQAQDGAITMTVSESVAVTSAEANVATMGSAVAESVVMTTTESGIADIAAAVAEAIAVTVDQWVAGATVEGVIAEAVALTTAVTVDVQLAGLISESLAVTDAVTVISNETGTVTFTATIVEAVIGNLVTSLGVTEAVAITTTESGSVISATFTTPDGRTLRVSFDSRTLDVQQQVRTLFVSKTTH